MCVRIEVVTPDPCVARAFTSDEGATFTTGWLIDNGDFEGINGASNYIRD